MSNVPVVIRQFPQPTSGGTSAKPPKTAGNTSIGGNAQNENVDTSPGNGAEGWVQFSVVEGYGSATPAPTFETQSATGQFTVTSGYSKINVVDVPQRIGITVFAGFDPVVATLPILFDNFGHAGNNTIIEKAINVLEWMAGRGESVSGHVAPASARETKPPAVRVVSNDINGNPTGIIPHQYRHVKWIITGLEWGASIREERTGLRQRQFATVTLMEENGTPDYSPTELFKATNPPRKWRPYTVPPQGNNTCIKIAKNVLKKSGGTAKKEAQAIKDHNSGKNGLSIRSVESEIRANAKIQIPG
jgi:hypothetical protein